MALTDAACRNAKPRDKDYKLSDSGRLYLLVRSTGSKLWRMNCEYQGKHKTLSFGIYPTTSLADARVARDAAKAKLAKGTDPSPKASVAEDNKFRNVAERWFAARSETLAPSTALRTWSRLEANAFPEIGDKDVADIEPTEVLAMLRKIEARGKLEIAKRVRQSVSSIFRFAVADGKAKYDPAATLADAMQRRPRTKHRPALSESHLAEFYKSLRNFRGEERTALAVEFVMHTFVRSKEILFAKVAEFEKGSKIWRIPEERMKMRKEHLVPLSDHVITIVDRLRDMAGSSEWLLPDPETGRPVSENVMLNALYDMGYKSKATIHGFRSTASTILNESGLWRPDAVERQLAHVPQNEVRAAYNAALYIDERTRMMDWYTDFLLKKDTDLSDLLS